MIITSFSQEGYREYGKRFIEGFLNYWEDEQLSIYVEGDNYEQIMDDFPEFSDPKLPHHDTGIVDLLSIEEFAKFSELIEKSDPMFSGRMRNPKTGEETYNFRYDAGKFFRKVFAITEYNKYRPRHKWADYPMAWLDADTVFHRKLPVNFLTDCLAGHHIAYLGRTNMYSETGFMCWDPKKEGHEEFMKLYRDMYLSGAFRYLSEWHDCQVFDTTRTLLECDARNLAKGCDPNHPFVYSVLGTYMDHLKGPDRKALGHSPEGQAHVA